MPEPVSPKPYYKKDLADRAVDKFAQIENPTQGDLNAVLIAGQIQNSLDRYRAQALRMNHDDFVNEKHRSKRLAKLMTCAGDPRPSSRCDCHAIVSGAHPLAAPMRAVLAWCKVRIDDPRNGCWLPRTEADRSHMPAHLKQAIPHSRIHRKAYYEWLTQLIGFATISNEDDLTRTLKMVKVRLQAAAVPPRVMPRR